MRYGSRLYRWWLYYGEFGYWVPEEKPRWWPSRLNEWWGEQSGLPPMWIWRPYCWFRRSHEDDSYGACVVCRKPLP